MGLVADHSHLTLNLKVSGAVSPLGLLADHSHLTLSLKLSGAVPPLRHILHGMYRDCILLVNIHGGLPAVSVCNHTVWFMTFLLKNCLKNYVHCLGNHIKLFHSTRML